MIEINKGLDIPIKGKPINRVEDGPAISKVALVGDDYVGIRPSFFVKVGDSVKIGTPLFECKKNPGINYTSPAAGKIIEINRGEKRHFQSIVVEVKEQHDASDFVQFNPLGKNLDKMPREEVVTALTQCGLWTALRRRPFSKVPQISEQAKDIFVSIMDTNPLAYNPATVLHLEKDDFINGVKVLLRLTNGRIFICKKARDKVDTGFVKLLSALNDRVVIQDFLGVHPAGNVGTHIHFLSPVDSKRSVWHIGFQDVIAFGKFSCSGKIWTERYISLGGPLVNLPIIYKTRLGANLSSLVKNRLIHEDSTPKESIRIISGSILNGRMTEGDTSQFDYLGRYHNQISVISNHVERSFLGWICPGLNKFSKTNTFLSRPLLKLNPKKEFELNSALNGSFRALVPIGLYETVMPLDILATPLLRALLTKDLERCEDLGALELDEEDLALLTYVSIGKTDYCKLLRETLTAIEKEQ